MMKRLVILLAFLAVVLSACNSGESAPAAEKNTEAAVETTAETVLETTEEKTTEDEQEEEAEFASMFTFSTVDREGNTWTEQTFAEHKVTILNFWEPWCGPCVGEMPDLQRVYEENREKGLLILGIYSTPGAEEEVSQVLEDTGVQYPILNYVPEFDFLQTGYVPTTIFVNQKGQILFQPFSGSLGYEEWTSIVEELLK